MFTAKLLGEICRPLQYRNDPKFSDRKVWANSADPDQTAPRSSLFAIPVIFWTKYPKVCALCLNFREITDNFLVCENLGTLRY